MNQLAKVSPAKPPAPYIGGKRNLAATLIKRINAVSHKTYVEPFCGMGGVFFRRDHRPPCEVINDYNGEVTNLFRILQRHYGPFMDMMRFMLTNRQDFMRLKMTDPATLTDLERAARFLYLQKNAFGGRLERRAFGVAPETTARFNSLKVGPIVEKLHERLSGVVIENLSYEECIKRYDKPSTLFYLDPPYWGTEGEYGSQLFSKSDFEKIADLLASIRGRFILSLNDCPAIRENFQAFQMEEVNVTYSIAEAKRKTAGELIIWN